MKLLRAIRTALILLCIAALLIGVVLAMVYLLGDDWKVMPAILLLILVITLYVNDSE